MKTGSLLIILLLGIVTIILWKTLVSQPIVDWQEIDPKTVEYSSKEVLWENRPTESQLVLFYKGKLHWYSGSTQTYVHSSPKGSFQLQSRYPFSIIGDSIYFHQPAFDSFSMSGDSWYKIEGNSYEHLSPPDSLSKRNLKKFWGKILRVTPTGFIPLTSTVNLKSIFDIKQAGVYYVAAPGLQVIHCQSLIRE